MFENLELFQIAQSMAVHAGQRQALLAQNVANADTPGYRAQDIPAFKSTYESSSGERTDGTSIQRATRGRHLNGVSSGGHAHGTVTDRAMASPDGNTVSIENEMLKATETMRQHERAVAIYKSGLSILRTSLGGT